MLFMFVLLSLRGYCYEFVVVGGAVVVGIVTVVADVATVGGVDVCVIYDDVVVTAVVVVDGIDISFVYIVD